MTAGSSDYFSEAAVRYARHRPRYPAGLAAWLAQKARQRNRAWDCGTGSGQAAVALAPHFREVIATDLSEAQLRNADRVAGVTYAAMAAESPAIASHSVDLITVAQALHWFDLSRFYTAVDRVLLDGGLLAVWTYGLVSVSPEIDPLIRDIYTDVLGAYWPAERALVDAGYAGIDLPFAELEVPAFEMNAEWTAEQFAAYVDTWSAVTRFRRQHGRSPVPDFLERVAARWGTPDSTRRVIWPLKLRVGRKGT